MTTLLKNWSLWQIDAAAAGVCIVLTLVFCCVGIRPLHQARAEYGVQQAQLAERRFQASQLETLLGQLRERLDIVRRTLAASPLHLEPASNVNRRLSQLSDQAAKAGLEINEIRPGPAAAGSRYETIPVLLAGRGSYSKCTRFLRALHKSFPDTAVRSLDLTASGTGPADAESTAFRFNLRWHAAPGPRTQ